MLSLQVWSWLSATCPSQSKLQDMPIPKQGCPVKTEAKPSPARWDPGGRAAQRGQIMASGRSDLPLWDLRIAARPHSSRLQTATGRKGFQAPPGMGLLSGCVDHKPSLPVPPMGVRSVPPGTPGPCLVVCAALLLDHMLPQHGNGCPCQTGSSSNAGA